MHGRKSLIADSAQPCQPIPLSIAVASRRRCRSRAGALRPGRPPDLGSAGSAAFSALPARTCRRPTLPGPGVTISGFLVWSLRLTPRRPPLQPAPRGDEGVQQKMTITVGAFRVTREAVAIERARSSADSTRTRWRILDPATLSQYSTGLAVPRAVQDPHPTATQPTNRRAPNAFLDVLLSGAVRRRHAGQWKPSRKPLGSEYFNSSSRRDERCAAREQALLARRPLRRRHPDERARDGGGAPAIASSSRAIDVADGLPTSRPGARSLGRRRARLCSAAARGRRVHLLGNQAPFTRPADVQADKMVAEPPGVAPDDVLVQVVTS